MDFEPEDGSERETHGMFASLREHFVEVAADFTDRVSKELVRRRGDRGPSFLGLLGSMLVETSNLFTGWAAPTVGKPDDDVPLDGINDQDSNQESPDE